MGPGTGAGRRLRALLCLLLALRAGAAGSHGCLFDRRLCSPQEVCMPDGLFGQCQVGAGPDPPYFQVTSAVLRRLQDVLRHLMGQGLSWQDDITQYVISREMERIPRLRDPAPEERLVSHPNVPRRAPFPAQSAQPWGQRPAPEAAPRLPPAPAPAPRYPEHLLLPLLPELGYEGALLHPYSYRKFGYQDTPRPLGPFPGDTAGRSPEAPALLGRAPGPVPPAVFGASPVPSYGAPVGPEGGPLFQDLGMLYLSREMGARPGPAGAGAQRELGHPQDGRDRASEKHLAPDPRKPPTEPADAALQKVLVSYGLGLRDLTPEQVSTLSALLQLIQSSGGFGPTALDTKRVTEGEMQHGEEPEPPASTPPPPETAASPAPGLPTVPGHALPSPHPGLLEKKSYGDVPGRTGAGAPILTRPPEEYGYIVTNQKPLSLADGIRLLEVLAERVHLSTASFINISIVGPALTFRLRQNPQNLSLADVADRAALVKAEMEAKLGLRIVQTGVGQRNEVGAAPRPVALPGGFHSLLLAFVGLACAAGVGVAAAVAACLHHHAKRREKERLVALGPEGAADTPFEYQELCRQHMAAKSLFGRADPPAPVPAETSRVSSVSSQFSDAPQASPSSHSSTPSWCEEPAQSNMDISTGHMILAYMEDHLRNRDRLAKEWQALCAYQAEPNACSIAQSEANLKKNRHPDFVPYDHARIKLKADCSPSRSDFINASPIIEHDPRMPAYIATQGPLSHTIADFWQMVWEHGCTVIVMLSPLAEDSVKQCDRYWPDEGSSLYHVYEVNLVSEHIWCEDFLVRSFYLKNVQSQETRTLTQFHFLSWPAQGLPATTRPLLDFRRKVNKCYRGRSCPIIVHCSDGASRTGTYILIDMVLNRMAKGVKEIDIAATLEHIRDQRPGMVQTKDQFEYALTAVAEEVNAILKALPQ
ncbi:receptor-type tyrosine-protein phosphatase-like N isoform X3 [Alligator mississippiensis]|uniref:receptor-type tyrosine-protein phosphatase-like N isoform X3 n=1 Tax=Alligator mississippiensis TaxID=8496 RepID=UPI002877700C|nr:receptor-type tyrosine-protein phosphatase-like N isoform X3 [Alligator mississippiensis]